jgi:hypothetical protein
MTDDLPRAIREARWSDCADALLVRLHKAPATEQKRLAGVMLGRYLSNRDGEHPARQAAQTAVHNTLRRDFSKERSLAALRSIDLGEDLDAADAAFENALDGYLLAIEHDNALLRTIDFAASVYASIHAQQVAAWIANDDADYRAWKKGRLADVKGVSVSSAARKIGAREWAFVFDQLRAMAISHRYANAHADLIDAEIQIALSAWKQNEYSVIVAMPRPRAQTRAAAGR